MSLFRENFLWNRRTTIQKKSDIVNATNVNKYIRNFMRTILFFFSLSPSLSNHFSLESRDFFLLHQLIWFEKKFFGKDKRYWNFYSMRFLLELKWNKHLFSYRWLFFKMQRMMVTIETNIYFIIWASSLFFFVLSLFQKLLERHILSRCI